MVSAQEYILLSYFYVASMQRRFVHKRDASQALCWLSNIFLFASFSTSFRYFSLISQHSQKGATSNVNEELGAMLGRCNKKITVCRRTPESVFTGEGPSEFHYSHNGPI